MVQSGIRCFVAIDLPGEMREEIAAVQNDIDVAGVKLVNSDLIHLTLKFLGDVPPPKLNKVKAALCDVAHPAFKAKVMGLGAFPGKSIRVIWIGAEGDFAELHRKVDLALDPLGFDRDGRAYSPHATIARVKQPSPRISQNLLKRLNPHKEIDLGEFLVDKFVLKKSTLTRGGPIYEDLEEFHLATP